MLMVQEQNQKSKEISSIQSLIDTYIRYKQYSTRLERKYDYYHPSEWGKCLRMQQYRHYVWSGKIEFEYPEMKSKKIRLFDTGHSMHHRFQDYFDDMGNILMGRWRCTNPLCYLFDDHGKADFSSTSISEAYQKNTSRTHEGDNHEPIFKPDQCVCGNSNFDYVETTVFNERLKFKGNADIVLNCDNLDLEKFKKSVVNTCDIRFLPLKGRRIVIDMKSIGSKQWDKQVKKYGVHRDYIIQIIIYAYLLNCDYGVILYENKDDSQMELFKIDKDPQIWEVIQFQAEQMIQMRSTSSLPPPRPSDKDDLSCLSCDFRRLCHKSSIWNDPHLKEGRSDFYKCLL